MTRPTISLEVWGNIKLHNFKYRMRHLRGTKHRPIGAVYPVSFTWPMQ